MQDDGDPGMAPAGVTRSRRARGDKAKLSIPKVGSLKTIENLLTRS
jgi:hypothetical protein